MRDKLDEKDIKIMNILKDHAEYTTRQVAKKTLLPVTTVHNRIRKLRKERIIQRYTIIPDYPSIDRGFSAYILVSVSLPLLKEKRKSQYDVARELKRLDFVEKADIVSGGTDLVVFVRVKDVSEFDNVLLTRIQAIEGIERTQSFIVIHGT